MPGPYWTHQVNQAGSDIDDCRRKLDNLIKSEGGGGCAPRQVFRNGNTVVEIAIKTKKDDVDRKNEWRRVDGGGSSSEQEKKKVVKRTTVVERLTEAEAEKERARTAGIRWGKSLATGQLPKRPPRSRSGRSRQRRYDADLEESSASTSAASDLKRSLELRTAKILLKDLRSALEAREEEEEEEGGDGRKEADREKVEALLEDVEFVLGWKGRKEGVEVDETKKKRAGAAAKTGKTADKSHT